MRLPPTIEPPLVAPRPSPQAPSRGGSGHGVRGLLLGFGAVAALSIPATVLAAGNGSAHQHAGMTRHTASAQHGSTQPGTTKSNGNGAGDRDVPGAANDPSAPRHDHDNGKGNDCDPGLGGSPNDTGNDRRFGEGDSTCQQTSGQKSGSEKGEKGSESKKGNKEQSPPTVTQEQSGSVAGASGGHGGGGFNASSGNHGGGGVNAAGGGVAAAAGAAAARGVGLANTGAKLPIFGGLGVLLIALGTLLMRRRHLRAQEI